MGAFVDLPFSFEDRPNFNLLETQPSVVEWIADLVSDLCRSAVTEGMHERPIVLPIPAASLGRANLVAACMDAVMGSRLCPQEICFELTDAALAASPCDVTTFFRNFRQRGFRIAVDARSSWQADLRASTWLLVDTLRVGFDDGEPSSDLMATVDLASSAGVAIIAERAHWRDGEYLASLGIEYGLHPLADA
ncbi:MAG: hypothetical protein AAFV54_13820 [Pseudomonadota bacterium]